MSPPGPAGGTTQGVPSMDPAACGCDGPVSGGCQIDELFALLSRAHMMDLLYLFMREDDGPWRFKDLQGRLDISPNTLSERLKDLVAAGLVEREAFQEIPPRVEYTATRMTHDLKPAFTCLREWADHHELELR